MFLNNGFNPDLSGVNQAGKERAVGWGTNTYAPKGNYAPKPTTSTGVGQWTTISFVAAYHHTTLTLPAGGTWAYYVPRIWNSSKEADQPGLIGIAAGGSEIFNVVNYSWDPDVKILCYRIA